MGEVGLMGRWGRAGFQELKDLERRLDRLERGGLDRFCREAARELAARLRDMARERTPAGAGEAGHAGGALRDAWTVLPVEKRGDCYAVTVVNSAEYASFVEFGHRQQPGRFVPVLGKQLRKDWVGGRFMLTVSEQELDARLPGLLERKLFSLLKEVF